MTTILNLALPFFGLILAGYVAAKIFRLPEAGLAWLNIMVVYFALPAMIFLTVAAAPFEKLIDWPFVLATTLATYLAFIIPFIFSVFVLRSRVTTAAIHGTSASFGNVGYMGLPLAVAFFGPPAAVPAALIFCFDSALQYILTPTLAMLGHSEEAQAQSLPRIWGKVVKSILTHPFILATFLGVLASAFKYTAPLPVDGFLQMISKAAGPSALFALGVALGMRQVSGIGAEFPLIVGTKLVLHPVLVVGLLWLLGWDDMLWLNVALMMAALPTATTSFVMAAQYNRYVEGASSSILITTVISAFTLPALVYAAQTGLFAF